jgi:hypothetical protein
VFHTSSVQDSHPQYNVEGGSNRFGGSVGGATGLGGGPSSSSLSGQKVRTNSEVSKMSGGLQS